jgi:F-type H+-transporting ATPase subunit delta
VHERVQGYTDAVVEGLGRDLETVAGQLEAFSALLASSADLRAALANPTTSAPVRRAIIQELLSKKVSAPVLDLLTFAVQSGPAADYAQDVAGIAAAGVAKRDGMVVLDEGPLGRTAAAERLDGYATAVLAKSGERHLGEIEDELFRFMRIVDGNEQLRTSLTTSAFPAPQRQAVVEGLLARRASAESARLATYAARIGRPRDYLELLEALVQRVAKEANRRVADVRSAVEMTPRQRARLAGALERFSGYPVEVRVTSEPALLGGFVAYVGDLVVDASLRHRLEQAREHLFAPSTPPGEPSAPGRGPH